MNWIALSPGSNTSLSPFKAQGNYTNVILHDGKKIVASKTLGDFEANLPARIFSVFTMRI